MQSQVSAQSCSLIPDKTQHKIPPDRAVQPDAEPGAQQFPVNLE